MNPYADDPAQLLDSLDVKNAMMVGHSTGGEVARYIGRHGTGRVSKAVLIGAVPPTMLKTAANPGGSPIEFFDGRRGAVTADRSGFYKSLAMPFFGYNWSGANVSQGVMDSFWLQGMLGGIKGQYNCIKQFSETDFTDDLNKMTIPTLVLHGDDGQIVPIADASIRHDSTGGSRTMTNAIQFNAAAAAVIAVACGCSRHDNSFAPPPPPASDALPGSDRHH